MVKSKSSSFAPNALKHYGGKSVLPGGATAKLGKPQGKIGVYSSMNKGKEIYGGTGYASKEVNKGPMKRGKK